MKRLVLFAGMVYLLMSCAGSPGFSDGKGDMDWQLFRGDAALSGHTEYPLFPRSGVVELQREYPDGLFAGSG